MLRGWQREQYFSRTPGRRLQRLDQVDGGVKSAHPTGGGKLRGIPGINNFWELAWEDKGHPLRYPK